MHHDTCEHRRLTPDRRLTQTGHACLDCDWLFTSLATVVNAHKAGRRPQ
jgi:hypothetical protein